MQFWFRNATWLLACACCCAVANQTVLGQQTMVPEEPGEAYAMGDAMPHSAAEQGYPMEPEYGVDGPYGEPICGCGDSCCDGECCYSEWPCDEVLIDRGWWRALRQKYRFRHSSIDGRSIGRGYPLRGTSWLNRPYSFGLETGGFMMASRISSNNTRNNDVLLAASLGWDWDHYWGTQFRVGWTTPELHSNVPSTQVPSNNVLMYDLSLMYYPWGDSKVRPYYRFGLGMTDIDFITPAGIREDNTMFSLPIGVGIKYQTKRWVALRAEAADYITFSQNSASHMQNFTLTFGMEWRFGGRPNSAWSGPRRECDW